MTRLVVMLFIVGGLATAVTPESHMVVTGSVALTIAGVAAAASTGRYLVVRSRLKRNPMSEVVRLEKTRRVRRSRYRLPPGATTTN